MIPVSARNIDFVGNSDQGGRGDGVQVMVHQGHAFIGHMFSDGFTVVDGRKTRGSRARSISSRRRPAPIRGRFTCKRMKTCC